MTEQTKSNIPPFKVAKMVQVRRGNSRRMTNGIAQMDCRNNKMEGDIDVYNKNKGAC